MNDAVIKNAISYLERLFSENADGHGVDHAKRVFHNAMQIADQYPDANREWIGLASLLHDADDHKLFQTENNSNTRCFLKENGISAADADQICAIINSVSFSKNRGKSPQSIEGKIVQDADRLDAIVAIGIARTFAFGGSHGRPLDDSISHFHEKLLLIKDLMNTPAARSLAEKRHAWMEQFLTEYEKETRYHDD